MTTTSDQNEYRAARLANAEKTARPRPGSRSAARFATTHSCVAARALAGPAPDSAHSEPVRLAGRIGNLRNSGKLLFATLYDRSRADAYRQQTLAGRADIDGAEGKKERGIQLFVDFKVLGEAAWKTVEALDLADWVRGRRPGRAHPPRRGLAVRHQP